MRRFRPVATPRQSGGAFPPSPPACHSVTTFESAAAGCEAETVFRVASITKPFTATLALGLLDLEAPTGVWPDDVRIRHLLSHTSGYDCECGDLARFGSGDDALAGAVAELPSVRRFLPVETAWSYANTGFWLAARLAAERSGEPFEAALAARVLAPAGLESTSFGEPELVGTGSEAKSEAYPRARRPSGGLVSNGPRPASLRTVAPRPAGVGAPPCAARQTARGRLRARPLRRASRRRRGVGPRRVVRRLPVVVPRRSRPATPCSSA